jgi:hypothetical protein
VAPKKAGRFADVDQSTSKAYGNTSRTDHARRDTGRRRVGRDVLDEGVEVPAAARGEGGGGETREKNEKIQERNLRRLLPDVPPW